MTMPTDNNISPQELWLELCKKERPFRLSNMPETSRFKLSDGSPAVVAIRVLTSEECAEASFAAERFVKEQYKKLKMDVPKTDDISAVSFRDKYDDRIYVEILYTACRNPEDMKKPFFISGSNSIANILTNSEIAVLYNQYLLIEQELGPAINKLEDYEIEAYIEKLATGGSIFLASITADAARVLLKCLALHLAKLRTRNISVGSQQEEHI